MPRKTESDRPADWLLVAKADLALVRHSLGDDVAFFACRAKLAEALEKLLKGELVRLGWRLVKTHDLQLLADELSVRDQSLEVEIRPLCQALADAYLPTRYPGFDLDDPDWPTLRAQFDALSDLAARFEKRARASAAGEA